MRTHPGTIEPEVYFRIVYVALDSGNGTAVIRQQMVEIALLPSRCNPKQPREPKTPRVVELLRKAIEWQALLESGKIANQADIAHREGITRARVTQVMGMLRLAPEIREKILSMPDRVGRPSLTERMLRPIGAIQGSQIFIDSLRTNLL